MKLIRTNVPMAEWSSYDRLSPLRSLLDSAFALAGAESSLERSRGWLPALDVYEDEHSVTVRVEVAGMKKKDFDIQLHEDALTVSGERKAENESREGESFRSERFFGAFSRSVQLPSAVKPDGVTAEYTDGILTVVLPKADEAKPKKIEVSVK